jgi:NAD(P)-dependent dehydrogenase (short-subunit alcohol dehydrogenase family)
MNALSGSRIVVCGGSSGIGKASAKALHELGAAVTIAGRSEARLAKARDEIGDVDIASLDCACLPEVAGFFEAFGSLSHVVISLAGGAALGPFATLDDEALRETFDGKFWPYMNAMRAAIPHLEPTGSITMVTGASAISAAPGAASLAAVNGALEGLLKTLAVELAPRRINAVSPGLTDTEAWSRVPQNVREDMYAKAAAETPAGRVGRASDVAGAVASCVTNDFLTGVILPCDGGKRLN